jgi:hypothetical protein
MGHKDFITKLLINVTDPVIVIIIDLLNNTYISGIADAKYP